MSPKNPIETAPLFDITPPPRPSFSSSRPFGARTVRRVLCAAGAHMAGLIVGTGEHLVWRPHLVHNVTGSTWPCSASGKCLCEVPAPPCPLGCWWVDLDPTGENGGPLCSQCAWTTDESLT
jgi:hypothetical protein